MCCALDALCACSWDRANSLLQEALEQLAHHEMVTFQVRACVHACKCVNVCVRM